MNYYLAPMEGVTGYVFRSVYHQCFPAMDKYFTPFLSPNADGKLSPREYQDLDPEHNQGMHVVPQILTHSAGDFIRTAKTLISMGYDEVNFNLGCPSGTVVSKGKGSGFLAFPEKLNACLYEIFSRLEMKISIKTRIGKEQPEEFEQLLEIYNQYKMEELIIHPRVQKDGYKNTPCLPAFRYAYEKSTNPLCYNGDIYRAEDKEKIMQQFPKLPAMMLGRGIVSNPGLLQCFSAPDGVCSVSKEQLEEFHHRLYEAYCRAYLHVSGPKVVLFKMKEIWCYLSVSFGGESKAVKKIKKAQNLKEYEDAVRSLF
ncbi:MAG: tRNA-dihydrouridine synthase family protein [Lachnospiraceae bacterium]|nr:tRNA-dihydrouridine synthase family protein [Lachnospiraceae bacterium]